MIAEEALYRVLVEQLRGRGYAVYADVAPAGAAFPFIVFSVAGGGENNVRVDRQDANFTVDVQCVAASGAEAFAGAGVISAALNDRGEQDRQALATWNDGWSVTTITQGMSISYVEQFEGAAWIYHKGSQFSIVMEAR